jgi:hypothetical protein
MHLLLLLLLVLLLWVFLQGLQSDARFAEMFVRGSWRTKAQSPTRLAYVSNSVAASALASIVCFIYCSFKQQPPGLNCLSALQ